MSNNNRLEREVNTIVKLVGLYCQASHGGMDSHLCPDCNDLKQYALQRLDHCPYGPSKPTCANCPIHCYRPDRREQIRKVMRFAGPLMLFHHPLLAILHLVDGFRKPPKK